MELLKYICFEIIGPLIWLVFFAYAFAFSGISLEKAWKAKKFKLIWLYIWVILVGLYFLF
jgi:membrane protein DedA with SNARE-associated domain